MIFYYCDIDTSLLVLVEDQSRKTKVNVLEAPVVRKKSDDKCSEKGFILPDKESNDEEFDIKNVVLSQQSLNDSITLDSNIDLHGINSSVGALIKYSSVEARYEYIVPSSIMNVKHEGKKRFMLSNSRHDCLMEEHWSHYKDPNWIKDFHKVVCGRLQVWKESVMKFCNVIDEKGTFPRREYDMQRQYASFQVTRMQNGLAKFNHFPVIILNEGAIMDMVDGVESFEDAQLIREIANCDQFSMRGIRDSRYNRVGLLTMFDNRNDEEMFFGDSRMED